MSVRCGTVALRCLHIHSWMLLHTTRWQLDVELRLPLDAGSVAVGINAASGHIRPTPAQSVPARLEIPVGGPTPTLSTTGFTSGDTVQGAFQVTATYSAPVSGVDVRNFRIVTVPEVGVQVTTAVSPTPSAASTTWVVDVAVSGPNAQGAVVYVHVSDDVEHVSPLPGSPTNSPVHVRCDGSCHTPDAANAQPPT